MMDNEQLVSRAFSRQSTLFDGLNDRNKLTEHLRSIYRKEVLSNVLPGMHILELNCGTGIDAVFFAEKGFDILATDNSDGMLDQLKCKIRQRHLQDRITPMLCSFNNLAGIGGRKYDYILSNFGGLNCSDNLSGVLRQFEQVLNKKGIVTLVIMPKVSPWELAMAFKGDFKTAFRRFRKNAVATIEGVRFPVYYYNPSYVIKTLKKDFDVCALKGIYFAVPPEFYKHFVERYPRTYKFLQHIENVIGGYFPFTCCCDHYMITLQKK